LMLRKYCARVRAGGYRLGYRSVVALWTWYWTYANLVYFWI